MSAQFEAALEYGAAAERVVAHYLKATRWVLDVRLAVPPTPRRGPRMVGPGAPLVLPDLLVFGGPSGPTWIEVKRKAGPGWTTHPHSRFHPGLATGMDTPAFSRYTRIQEETGIPVTVIYVHDHGLVERDRQAHPTVAATPGRVYAVPLNFPCQHRSGKSWYPLTGRTDWDDTGPVATLLGDTVDLFAAAGEPFNPGP